MKLNTFKFKCSDCGEEYEDNEIGATSKESECPMCGKWEYSSKPAKSESGYDQWGRKQKSER